MPGIDSYTKLCLHMDGADASTTFTDSSSGGKSVTANGNAQIDTAQSKFGGASGLFDGSGDYLSIPDNDDWDFGSGDFTIDFWVKSTTTGRFISGQINSAGNANFSFAVYFGGSSSNKMVFSFSFDGTAPADLLLTSTTAITDGNWHHIAAVRSGSDWDLYIDGVSEANASSSSAIYNSSEALTVGRAGAYTSSTFLGWLDEFRISKGIARWTSDFTPPTEAYSADSGRPMTTNKGWL